MKQKTEEEDRQETSTGMEETKQRRSGEREQRSRGISKKKDRTEQEDDARDMDAGDA